MREEVGTGRRGQRKWAQALETKVCESVPLRTTRVPEPERLRPGRCMQPRAGLGQFPVEQPRA